MPGLGSKLQPPEVLFLVLAGAAALAWWRNRARWRFSPIDLGVAAWTAANLLALAMTWQVGRELLDPAVIEVAGVLYLSTLYAVVRVTATRERVALFASIFTWSATLAAVIGIGGVALSWAGVTTRLATVSFTPVPYLGTAARALGFTAHPGMLASILVLGVLLHVGRVGDLASKTGRGWRGREWAVLVVLLAGLAVLGGLAAAGRPGTRLLARSAVVAWLVVTVVFTVAAHTMLVRTSAIESYRVAELVSGQSLADLTWQGENWTLMPTTYVANKQASWHAVFRSWPWGVGPAGQPAFSETLREEGLYPPMLTLTEPHSTYSGAAAELGVGGTAALLLLLGTVAIAIRRLARLPALPMWVMASYAGAGAAFLIEATATDLMSCRHYWWLLAIIASRDPLPPASPPSPGR